jgi:hypothetical protein
VQRGFAEGAPAVERRRNAALAFAWTRIGRAALGERRKKRRRALISYKDDRADHQLGAAPTGSEYGLQIGERLPRLVRERGAGG